MFCVCALLALYSAQQRQQQTLSTIAVACKLLLLWHCCTIRAATLKCWPMRSHSHALSSPNSRHQHQQQRSNNSNNSSSSSSSSRLPTNHNQEQLTSTQPTKDSNTNRATLSHSMLSSPVLSLSFIPSSSSSSICPSLYIAQKRQFTFYNIIQSYIIAPFLTNLVGGSQLQPLTTVASILKTP